MTVEEVSERPECHTLQREQERERRRMRDRQRRQSMSLEQREKHLARRRRNYQLRRQRAENAQLDSSHVQTSITARGELKTENENQALVADLELSVQCDGVVHVGFDTGQENLNASATKYEGVEGGAQKSAKFPQRLRLSKIRHLARLLNTPVGKLGAACLIGAEVATKENARTNCISRNVRLVHVKRLARALNSSMKETANENHLSETQVEKEFAARRDLVFEQRCAEIYAQSEKC